MTLAKGPPKPPYTSPPCGRPPHDSRVKEWFPSPTLSPLPRLSSPEGLNSPLSLCAELMSHTSTANPAPFLPPSLVALVFH